MARTASEEARLKRLATIKADVRARSTVVPTQALDLSTLPVETKMRLCVPEYDEKLGIVLINDDPEEVAAILDVGVNPLTLRQANFGVYTHKNGAEETAAQIKAVKKDRRFRTANVDCVGRSLLAQKTAAEYKGDGRGAAMGVIIKNHPADLAFIGQHTITFPATFYGRIEVSFLGLPAGTLLPLKNGGCFIVVKRQDVEVHADGSTTGNLLVTAMDDKAMKLALSMGWGPAGARDFVIPSNLYTCLAGGRAFDTAAIKLPFRDPFDNFGKGFFEGEAALKYPQGKAFASAAAGDPFTDALDDLLFG